MVRFNGSFGLKVFLYGRIPDISDLGISSILFLAGMIKVTNSLPGYCVYILFSEHDQLLYIGYSSNLSSRIERHNAGNTPSTKGRRPLRCIFSEYFLFEEDARKREGYLKTTMGRKAIRIMLNSTLHKLGYSARTMRKMKIENG